MVVLGMDVRQTLVGRGAKKKAANVRAQVKLAVNFLNLHGDDDDQHQDDQMWSFDVPIEPEDDDDDGEDQDRKVPIGIRRQDVVDEGWKAFAAMGELITLSEGLDSDNEKKKALELIQKGWHTFGANAMSDMRIATSPGKAGTTRQSQTNNSMNEKCRLLMDEVNKMVKDITLSHEQPTSDSIIDDSSDDDHEQQCEQIPDDELTAARTLIVWLQRKNSLWAFPEGVIQSRTDEALDMLKSV